MPDQDDGGISNITTPEQIDTLRQYYTGLLGQGIPTGSSGNVTAVSPWGGMAQMISSLVGGRGLMQAANAERGAMQAGAQNAPYWSPNQNTAENAQDNTGSPYASTTAAQESGGSGDYSAQGPLTKDGDHAYGRYQVKGSNIGPWTQEVLGYAMTPEQFLSSPQAQDAVYNAKFGQYVQKYGPEGAAKAWFAGEHGMNNPNARAHTPQGQPYGPTVAQYGQQFAQNAPQQNAPQQPSGGQPMAFSGGAGMGPPMPNMAPSGAVGPQSQPALPPGLVPYRPPVSRQQFVNEMANPYVSPEQKQAVWGAYYSQGQPLEFDLPWGAKGIVNPQNPSQQAVLPPPLQWHDMTANGATIPVPYAIQPPNYQGGLPKVGPVTGGGQQSAPQGGQQGGPQSPVRPPDLKFAEEQQALQGAGGLPPEITEGKSEPKISSQVGQQATQQGGMLGAAPPPEALPFSQTSGASPQGAPASGGSPANVPGGPDPTQMSPGQFMEWARERDIATESAKEFNKGDIKNYQDDYDRMQTMQQNAYNMDSQLAAAENIMHDPLFIQGPGQNLRMGWNQALAFLGDKNAEARVGLVNAFDKLTASNILSDMRSKLEGLGQVRNAEINLLEKATGTKYNTLAANQAILEMGRRYQQQAIQIGNLSNYYRQGYRWDKNGKLEVDENGNPTISNDQPTSAGQNQIINTYLSNHPLFNKEEIANYTSIFDQDAKGAPAGKKGAAGSPAGLTPEQIQQELQRRKSQQQPQQPSTPQLPN